MQISNNYYNTNSYQSTNVRKQNTANRNNPLNKTQSLSFFPRENNDDLAKMDYMSVLEEWRDMQKSCGNWAGYKQFSDVCNAFLPFCR